MTVDDAVEGFRRLLNTPDQAGEYDAIGAAELLLSVAAEVQSLNVVATDDITLVVDVQPGGRRALSMPLARPLFRSVLARLSALGGQGGASANPYGAVVSIDRVGRALGVCYENSPRLQELSIRVGGRTNRGPHPSLDEPG
jgi:hypothetical protein